jgi:hypothetical protein
MIASIFFITTGCDPQRPFNDSAPFVKSSVDRITEISPYKARRKDDSCLQGTPIFLSFEIDSRCSKGGFNKIRLPLQPEKQMSKAKRLLPIIVHAEGHKGHEDKSFEQEEREAAEAKIKKRSLVKPRSGGSSIVRRLPD